MTEATAEVFWTAFRALSKSDRKAIVARLLKDDDFMEDLQDIAIAESRKDEPTIPLDEHLERRRQTR